MTPMRNRIIAGVVLVCFLIGTPIVGRIMINEKERREAEEFERMKPTTTVAVVTTTEKSTYEYKLLMPGEFERMQAREKEMENERRGITEGSTETTSVVEVSEEGLSAVLSDKDVSESVYIPEVTTAPAVIAGNLPDNAYGSKEEAEEAAKNIDANDEKNIVTMELPKADGTLASVDFAKINSVYIPGEGNIMVGKHYTYYSIEDAKNNPVDGMILDMNEWVTDEYGDKHQVIYVYDVFSGKWMRATPTEFWKPSVKRWNASKGVEEKINIDGSWILVNDGSGLGGGTMEKLQPSDSDYEYWKGIADGWKFGGGE